MPSLTDQEKENLKKTLIFDLAKKFISNLNAYLDSEEDQWLYISKKTTLKGHALTISFQLRENTIEEKIKELDKAQKKIDDQYGSMEEDALESIPD